VGFWVKARRPRTKKRAHFECSLVWWGPLWEFTLEEAEDVLPEDVAFDGFLNQGAYVRAAWARKIAERLDAAIAEGRAARRARKRRGRVFDEETVREFSAFCRGSGGFWIC
jgi:hypothetical protein